MSNLETYMSALFWYLEVIACFSLIGFLIIYIRDKKDESEKNENENENDLKLFCSCGNNINDENSFISDDDEGVKYKCSVCGEESAWNFDLMPIPVKIEGNIPTPGDM